jgi:UDP-glucose 4-epimerase
MQRGRRCFMSAFELLIYPRGDMAAGRQSCIVLGGGGFLGINLCRRLASAGHRVRAFGRRCLFPEALEKIEWYLGDFCDATALAAAIETYDIVFHLVHTTTPHSANLDMAKDVQQNVVSSLALFDISRALGVERIVFVSSGGTIYGKPEQIPTPETAPSEPITAYGVGMLAIEKYLALHQRLYGLQYRILRVANPFGPFQVPVKNQGVISALISRAISNQAIEIWGDGSVVRDYIFVDDVVEALQKAMTDESDLRIFNIGSGRGRSLIEVIKSLEELLDARLQIDWKKSRTIDVPVSILAVERANAILGWAPSTPFEVGLQKTLDWWKSTAG